MTVIADKLKQAGVDTLGAEFYSRATEALRSAGSVRGAWLRLGETWGHAILTRIWADMQGKSKSGDQQVVDAHTPIVSRPTSSSQFTLGAQPLRAAARSTAGGGQTCRDTQAYAAAASNKSKKPKEFFKQKGASEATKLINRQAALTGSALFSELKMDRLRVRELDGFIREQAQAGGNHALKARWECKRAAVAWLIKRHATFVDDDEFVKNCVTSKDMTKYVAMADKQANVIVAKIVAQAAKEIDRGIKLIAAE